MNRLLEKCALTVICMPGFFMSGDLVMPVIMLLVSVSVSAVGQLIGDRPVSWVLVGVYSLMCGVFPVMFCAMPLMLYDALCFGKWWLVLPAAAIAANPGGLTSLQFLIAFAGALTALIIYIRISRLESSVEKLKTLRDDITEKNIQLASQNVKLAAAQDNEVRIATLKERNRIAREIHDNVGHMLTRSILQTGALKGINKDDALAGPLDELKNTLDGAMTSIRSSVHDLHDDSIDLKRAIEEITSAVDDRFGVSLSYDAGEHIPGEIKLCIAGIVKESVSNAVKHSDGDKISIVFREHPAFYQLLVRDNGKNAAIGRGGIGLKNMEDRAAGVGGHVTFTPSESGFEVFMTVPKER